MLGVYLAVVSAVAISTATNFKRGEYNGELKDHTNEMIGVQYNLIELTEEDDLNSRLHTMRNKMGVSIENLNDKNLGRQKIVVIMGDHVRMMQEQCNITYDLLNEVEDFESEVDCYQEIKTNVTKKYFKNQAGDWEKDWNTYKNFWENYQYCCKDKLQDLVDKNNEYTDEEGENNNEDEDDNIQDEVSVLTEKEMLVIILGISVPTLLILIVSITLYLVMRTRYRIVRRSIRLKSLSTKHPARDASEKELPGEGDTAPGDQNRDKEPLTHPADINAGVSGKEAEQSVKQQNDDEEEPLYDDIYLKTRSETPQEDQENLYNTLANENEAAEDEQRMYSVLGKPCSSTKPDTGLLGDRNLIFEREGTGRGCDTICQTDQETAQSEDHHNPEDENNLYSIPLRKQTSTNEERSEDEVHARKSDEIKQTNVKIQHKRYSCSLDLNQTLIQRSHHEATGSLREEIGGGIVEEEYSTIGHVKVDLFEAAISGDCEEASYSVLNRSQATSDENTLETGQPSTITLRIKPPKERPLSKRYSSNLELNNTLNNQQSVQEVITKSWVTADIGLAPTTFHPEILYEEESSEDPYQIPDELIRSGERSSNS